MMQHSLFTDDTLLSTESRSGVPAARTSLIPRDYQQAAINKTFEIWDSGTIGAMCRIPTGGGKTLTGTLIADLWLQRGDDYRVLILAHEVQLIDQFAQEIEDVLRVRPAIEMSSRHCRGTEKIIVGSRQTLQVRENGEGTISRLYKFRPDLNWLLILDESHRWARKLKQCRPIIEWFEQNPVHRRLGLTATPERTDKVSFKSLFQGVSSDYRLYDIDGGPSSVNDGWAVPYDQRYIVLNGVDFEQLKVEKGEYDAAELERVLGEQGELAKLCDPTIEIVGRRRTLIFSPTTSMAKNVALYINAKLEQAAAKSLDGSYPDAIRKQVYREHQTGAFQFLSVCGLCREGYNDPDIQAIAIFRPSKSRSLVEQMKGRGCRPMRGVVSSEMTPEERRKAIAESDKPYCLIVDLCGVTGLGDVPSTVDILAEGKPDEVIARANKKLLEKPSDEQVDVQKAIRDAEHEIAEEKRLAREEQQRRRQEEFDRRAKLGAKVDYKQHKVKSGQAGKSHKRKRNPNPPSEGMCKYLWALGVKKPDEMSAQQARGVLGKLTSGHGRDYVVRGGPHKGKTLKELPVPVLKDLVRERNSGNKYDNEFQAEVQMYRKQWLRDNKGQPTEGMQ